MPNYKNIDAIGYGIDLGDGGLRHGNRGLSRGKGVGFFYRDNDITFYSQKCKQHYILLGRHRGHSA